MVGDSWLGSFARFGFNRGMAYGDRLLADRDRGGPTLHLNQSVLADGRHRVEVTLLEDGGAPRKAVTAFELAMSDADRERVRWYLEDYLEYPLDPAPTIAAGVEQRMAQLGKELFSAIFNDRDTAALWNAIQGRLAQTRVQIETEVAEATGLPWELLRDPLTDIALALRVSSFVRVNHRVPGLVVRPTSPDRVLRVLLVICRPGAGDDVPFRSVAGRLIHAEPAGFLDLTVLRPPTYKDLARELERAHRAGEPYHVVHFDGHGDFLDTGSSGGSGGGSYSQIRFGLLNPPRPGRHGYLLFEDTSSPDNLQLVDGPALGALLAGTGVSVLVLNACRSAYAEAPIQPDESSDATADVHARVRAYGSLALEITDAGVAGVVAMRYSVYVVTAAEFVADLYSGLLSGLPLGEAVTAGRRRLHESPERAIAFDPVPLRDWSVPVVYEAVPMALFTPPPQGAITITVSETSTGEGAGNGLPARPDVGFFGRDETLLALDRAFDTHRIVLLHAYAGQGKTSTAVEFARWYHQTGGLALLGGDGPVLFSTFEHHTPLASLLNQVGEVFDGSLRANGVAWQTLEDTERRDVALQVLKQMPVLWIWDNVEPVAGFPAGTPSPWTVPEQAELRDLLRDLAHTKARVLLTSRRGEHAWLGQLPTRVELPPMPMLERIQLTQAIAERHGHDIRDVEDWRPLLHYAGGNPLTITVLVGQALRDRLTTTGQIKDFVARLQAGEAGLDDDASQGRSASLGASLGYGFTHAFTDTERGQLALLHMFQDTVSVAVLRIMGHRDNETSVPELAGLTRESVIALLDRAAEIGLLTAHGGGYYTIHPVLPWYFTQLFTTTYGPPEHPAAIRATHAYTAAIADVGRYYFREYQAGRHQAIEALAVEEANLLHARRLARHHQRWHDATGAMQGLRALYEHLGRHGEWARLVEELTTDLVDPATDQPLPGRHDLWSIFTSYRVGLARQNRDWTTAHRLQTARVAWDRDRAADTLAIEPAALSDRQRHRIHTLADSLHELGQILRELRDSQCITHYHEATDLYRKIGARKEEATAAFNLGSAYLRIPSIRDLDQAERWYGRDLELMDEDDQLGYARTTGQLGTIAYDRFVDARAAGASHTVLAGHLIKAENYFREALDLTPEGMPVEMAIGHIALGNVYTDAGQFDTAIQHYQKAIKNWENTGDRHAAGQARFNLALTLAEAGRYDEALLYAQAARRDFESYGASAFADIQKTQGVIADIEMNRNQAHDPE
jgi:tetratricopeptide (TPR) repeat protein